MAAGAARSATANLAAFEEAAPNRDGLACLAAGTLIHAQGGLVPVEDIAAGTRVMTADHGFVPVCWAGGRTVGGWGAMAPVLIEAGALGNGRDLRVSPAHRMLIGGARAELLFGSPEVLVAAGHLVDGRRVRRDPCDWVTYVHILFDAHQIIFAEGIPSESFHPGACGLGSLEHAQREDLLALFPRLRARPSAYGPAARASLRSWEARLLARL